MKKTKIEINLIDGIPGSKDIFAISGRELGYKQRKHHKIDNIEKEYDKIIINIDEKIIFMSSSFFLGMFGSSVRNCKTKEKFKETGKKQRKTG